MHGAVLGFLAVVGCVAGCGLAGCSGSRVATPTGQAGFTPEAVEPSLAVRLDRGEWLVSQRARTWRIFEDRADLPSRAVGFVVANRYRQVRGGPEFVLYQVTTLDRSDQIGLVDALGRAIRYEPQRGGGFSERQVAASSLEENVAAILGLGRPIRLEAVSERRLAFEALDANADGFLQPEETSDLGARIREADGNSNGLLEYEEFEAIDVL